MICLMRQCSHRAVPQTSTSRQSCSRKRSCEQSTLRALCHVGVQLTNDSHRMPEAVATVPSANFDMIANNFFPLTTLLTCHDYVQNVTHTFSVTRKSIVAWLQDHSICCNPCVRTERLPNLRLLQQAATSTYTYICVPHLQS